MPVFGVAVLWDPKMLHQQSQSRLSAFLHFVRDGALRFHAARRTNISNVHETIRNECALLCVHGPVTAGTLNDTRFLQTFLHKQPSR